jgi:heat-inducible transcriptional repressor
MEMNEPQLSDRQQQILRFLVEEYVYGTRAVGSRTLIEHYPLSVSSATVRNEMAALERMGFVEHTHRSSGSVPTDLGFRYYVEQFAGESQLSSGDQLMIRHQFRQAESQLESWLQLAATVLAEVAGNLSMVTSPHAKSSRLRHFELLSLHDRVVLLILVTQDSSISQSLVHLDYVVGQTELSAAADRINAELHGLTTAEARMSIRLFGGIDRLIAEHVVDALDAGSSGERTEVRHEGIEHIVRQPEFSAGGEELREFFRLLRGGALLSMILPQIVDDQGDVQVFIGEENRADVLQPFSVVVASYGVSEQVTGLLGIVGPRRMRYDRSISSVRYMAALMSDFMEDLYYAES